MTDHGAWLWARWVSPSLGLHVEQIAVAGPGANNHIALLTGVGERVGPLPSAQILSTERLRPSAPSERFESPVGIVEIGPLSYEGDDGAWTIHMIHLEQPTVFDIFEEESPDFRGYSEEVREAFLSELDSVDPLLESRARRAYEVSDVADAAKATATQIPDVATRQVVPEAASANESQVASTWFDRHPAFLPLAAASLLALVGAAPLPIGYYDFLRAVLMAAGVLIIIHSALSKQWGWIALGAALLVVWAPVTHLYLPAATWKVLDVVAAGLLLTAALLISARQGSDGRSPRWWQVAIVPVILALLFWSAISGTSSSGFVDCYPDPRGTYCE